MPQTKRLQVFEVDGEDLIVARDEKHAKSLFRRYHLESTRRHNFKLIAPQKHLVFVVDDWMETKYKMTAASFAAEVGCGYYTALR